MKENLLTPFEVQQILHISRSTFYRIIQSGKLPVVRVGGTYRVRTSELETYLSNTKKKEQ